MNSLFAQRIIKSVGRMTAAVVFAGIGTMAEDYVREFKKGTVNGFKDEAKQTRNLVSNRIIDGKMGKEPDDYDLI